MKQGALADLLMVNQQAVSKYELGQLDLSTEAIARLCEIFACTADYLLGLSAQREARISDADAALLGAYHAADDHTRQLVDLALQPFFEQAGSSVFTGEAG